MTIDSVGLSRIEDAGLNASAPPQQRWLDGWLLRYCPGKAKRARCINALAAGRLPLPTRLDLAAAVFRDAGLPLVFRVTPFSQPAGLDQQLSERGLHAFDDTHVMVPRGRRCNWPRRCQPAARCRRSTPWPWPTSSVTCAGRRPSSDAPMACVFQPIVDAVSG